ncbi:RDD family protein [Agrococcus sp. Marseille-Q4369]|uniref:RDD family protein n=1 Tax=Agrococcus sp. Marseille-Q4369 TaxID=2810513 RepID=UPI001B8B47E1|nr:RDD family protein [Agrococcus sp. Marseille-Q4369]QUW17693.1 RDD family protein [Agrococcus sp. Marseille-Q4369]
MIWEIDEGQKRIEGLDEAGRPDPAYAAALGLRPAPLGRRALASLIEFALYALLQLPYWIVAMPSLVRLATGALQPYGLATHPNLVWMIVATAVSFVLSTAFVIVQIVLHGRKGVTLGKAFTGIRSIHVATLERPGIKRSLGRALLLYAFFLVPIVGPALVFCSVWFDSEKRGRSWLDKAARTWFVDVRGGLDPYHEKKMRIARKTVQAEPEAAKAPLPSLATPADAAARAYRPGARTSSGVVGAARPQQPGAQQIGLASSAAEPTPTHTVPGMPAGGARLGGYRPGELSGSAPAQSAPRPSAPAAPEPQQPAEPRFAPQIGGIVGSVPGRAPAQPAAPAAPAAQIDEQTIIEPDLEAGFEVESDDGDAIDDRTVRRIEIAEPDDDLEATRARPSSRAAVATLAFDTGDRFAITGAALIGRNPAPSAGEVVEHLLPIADDTRSISKTHLLLTASPLAAIDRASTNGSSVVRAGSETPLEPGRAFPLQPGDVVRFGDRSLTVEAAS